MSREVRRVPLTYRHPVEFNQYWQYQLYTVDPYTLTRTLRPAPRLHAREERFVSLSDDYAGSLSRWEQELADLQARTGRDWDWAKGYHLTGYTGRGGSFHAAIPEISHLDTDGEYITVRVSTEEELAEILIAEKRRERPRAETYLPVFDVPESELGWVLYQTVSEGTPTTPVFASAEELIGHLCTVGEDYDQVPYRRSAAEALVAQTCSAGSFIEGPEGVLNSARDADVISDLHG